MSLKELRNKIDGIDKRILNLINQRVKVVSDISRLKEKNKMGVFFPDREADILRKIKNLNKGPVESRDIEIIFGDVLSICRAVQTTLNVAYLGPEGTFTHLAAIKRFGKRSNFISCGNISDVFDIVSKNKADYGVVPIENSIEGAVSYTLDVFIESNLKICSEVALNISHSLLRVSKKSLKKIYSNPQVFSQCRRWLLREYPKAQLIPTATTAQAAIMAKKDELSACIGNSMLAVLYNLKEVKSHIEDSLSNVTRFLVVSHKDSSRTKKDKTSILFSVKDKVGALYGAIYSFKKYGINLTKIESRPSKKKPWEYYFFVDFEGHRRQERVKKALRVLEKKCVFLKILGSYPKEV